MALALTRNRQLYLKVEAVAGTYEFAAPPVTADVVAEAFDIDITPEWEEFENTTPLGFFGRRPGSITLKPGRISFKIQLLPPDALGETLLGQHGKVLSTCGLEETLVASTTSTYQRGAVQGPFSASVWLDGERWGLAGAMASSARIVGTDGEPIIVEVELIGKWEDFDVQAVSVAPVAVTQTPNIFRGVGLVYDLAGNNFSPIFSSMGFDLGNETTLRMNASDPTGYETARIVDAAPIVTIDPEYDNANNDWLSEADAKALKTLTWTSGVTPQLLTASHQVVVMPPTIGERDGIVINDVELQPVVAVAGAVGDDFDLEWS